VAIVTGGGSGIGRASAFALALNSYAVVVAGRQPHRLPERVKRGSRGCADAGEVTGDLSDPGNLKTLFDRISETFERLDVHRPRVATHPNKV